ncbi:MAG: pitrilysin family protein [Burkholderiales bacterium]
MPKFLRILYLLAALASPVLSIAQGLPKGVGSVRSVEGIDEYRLANGLQVLLVPDDSKPTTTVNLTYRVGSRHENYGETGMAHLLEHMLFKGTPKNPKVWGEFQKRGLEANGSTWLDRTNYTAVLAVNDDNLKWYIGWLADSMVNSFIARKDLDTEMTVVRNEMESGENSPDRILLQRTMALMYDWHNYGHDTIGARADVENVDIPRLQAFYHQYYQPDNATLVVSGRMNEARVLAWIAQSFGAIRKPTRQLPALYTIDPAQDGERSVTLRRSGGSPVIYAGYHMPAAAAPDYAAVELLRVVLGDTPSGRLHKRLIETQLASAASASGFGLHDPGFFLASAELAPGQDVDKARAALLAAVESLKTEPVSAEELQRAKLKWLNEWDQAFTNPETIGFALSESIAQGDWRMFFLMRDRVRAMALPDVQRVAEAYLLPDNRTLATYLPTDKPLRAPKPARVDIASAMSEFKPAAAAGKVEAFEATPQNIDKRTQTFAVGNLKAALLPKGTRGGAVTAELMLRFGDETSTQGLGEIGDTVAAMLDKGTTSLSRQQVQDRLDALKTELQISGSANFVVVTLNSRREHLPAAIALVGDLLRHPALTPEALDEVRRQELTSIEQQRKEPQSVARIALGRLGNPYPRGDLRYERTPDEVIEDVNALTLPKLREFHTRFYGASTGEFAAVGDIDVAPTRAALEAAFGGWASQAPYTRVPRPALPAKAERLLLATPDKQNAFMLVRQALPLNNKDADFPALAVADYLLGGGSGSRLWKRIREGEGLSYGVGTGISWSRFEANSPWQAYAIFAPQNRAKVEAALNDEVAKALKEGFNARELAEGVSSLLAFRRLSRAQDSSLAAALRENQQLGKTFARDAEIDAAIAKLTLTQVNEALRKYLKPGDFAAAYAGDFKP